MCMTLTPYLTSFSRVLSNYVPLTLERSLVENLNHCDNLERPPWQFEAIQARFVFLELISPEP